MNNPSRIYAIALIASASLTAAACGGHKDSANGDVARTPAANGGYVAPANTPMATAPADTVQAHHSKLGGAVAGAAVGHMLGGHAVLGAAAGALVQHERNKHH
ncbi:MAG: hypothetical protein M3Z05_21835 [Gemmatimonadota bacterium]|nr:hypothetical protein [Gemmatimonadota bacterium]